MRIGANHRLEGEGVAHVESPNHGGPFASGGADTIVIHFTDSATPQDAIDTLCDPKRKVSAHLVVGRDESVAQLLSFDTVGWHAGESRWHGRSALNQYSIGIEVDNAGRLEASEGGRYLAWFGKEYPAEEMIRAVHRNESEPSCWHRFATAQVELVERLCALLIEAYGIDTIVGHEEIAPDRKDDPGPAFPLDEMRDRLFAERLQA